MKQATRGHLHPTSSNSSHPSRITIDITYDIDAPDLGPLSECIVDLDPDSSDARLVLTYGPRPTAPAALFTDLAVGDNVAINRRNLFRALGSRVQAAYAASLEAVDPNDPTNRKSLEPKTLTTLIRGGFINAQRGLDDDTHRERDVLGKVVEVLFQSALTDPVDPKKRTTAEKLKEAVEQIQGDLHASSPHSCRRSTCSAIPASPIRASLPRPASMSKSC